MVAKAILKPSKTCFLPVSPRIFAFAGPGRADPDALPDAFRLPVGVTTPGSSHVQLPLAPVVHGYFACGSPRFSAQRSLCCGQLGLCGQPPLACIKSLPCCAFRFIGYSNDEYNTLNNYEGISKSQARSCSPPQLILLLASNAPSLTAAPIAASLPLASLHPWLQLPVFPLRLPPPECSTFPHIIHLVTSGASLLVFVACALVNLGADFELSPLDKGYLAIANAGVEMHVSVCHCSVHGAPCNTRKGFCSLLSADWL